MATILVVDDEPAVRVLAARMLRQASYRALEAGSGTEALAFFTSHPSDIDLLLTDLVMPGLTGTDLAERVRQLRPDLPVLLMTGYSPAGLIAEGIAIGKSTLITKPFTQDQLVAKVREALTTRYGRSTSVSDNATRLVIQGLETRLNSLRRGDIPEVRRVLAPCGAVVAEIDPALRYVWIVNPHPDFDSQAVVGKRDDELLPPAEAQDILSLKREVFESKEPRSRILDFLRSDGRHYYSMSAYPVYRPDGEVEAVLTVAFPFGTR